MTVGKNLNCVVIHIGQCGLQLGQSIWELLGLEHGISFDGTFISDDTDDTSFKTFYHETPDGQYVPRALLVDLEPSVVGKFVHQQIIHQF